MAQEVTYQNIHMPRFMSCKEDLDAQLDTWTFWLWYLHQLPLVHSFLWSICAASKEPQMDIQHCCEKASQ